MSPPHRSRRLVQIQNEFGQQLWATYTDLLSGKAVLVKDDDSFDIVCDICEVFMPPTGLLRLL